MTTLVIIGDVACLIGGAVLWHIYATKVLGYVKGVANKL